ARECRHMEHDHDHADDDFDTDEIPLVLSSRIDQLSRRWSEEEDRPDRPLRRTRRRIEEWREEQSLKRQFDDDLDE
ncbi:MAG: hypothetical protein ACNA7W_14865, partial [Pseudomonadales bacterium]